MQGPFSAGAPTPEVGAIRGRTEGSVFVADLEVTIENLEQFLADPRHVAQLRGSVTFPPLATGRPLASGELEMYVPDLQRGAKLLRYSFTFSGDDEASYFFRGEKVLRTPFPSLRAQVTLFSEVRAGDENGPLWGAGILTFRWRDLPAFLASMRAEGCSRALALWRFGRFAQRELAFAPV
jgi:cholesterol oxidase